jgi:hypothetical protein
MPIGSPCTAGKRAPAVSRLCRAQSARGCLRLPGSPLRSWQHPAARDHRVRDLAIAASAKPSGGLQRLHPHERKWTELVLRSANSALRGSPSPYVLRIHPGAATISEHGLPSKIASPIRSEDRLFPVRPTTSISRTVSRWVRTPVSHKCLLAEPQTHETSRGTSRRSQIITAHDLIPHHIAEPSSSAPCDPFPDRQIGGL